MPILDFLPSKNGRGLRERCTDLLGEHFLRQLDGRGESGVLGNVIGGQRFGQDISRVKRITEIEVNHGENFDGELKREFMHTILNKDRLFNGMIMPENYAFFMEARRPS